MSPPILYIEAARPGKQKDTVTAFLSVLVLLVPLPKQPTRSLISLSAAERAGVRRERVRVRVQKDAMSAFKHRAQLRLAEGIPTSTPAGDTGETSQIRRDIVPEKKDRVFDRSRRLRSQFSAPFQ